MKGNGKEGEFEAKLLIGNDAGEGRGAGSTMTVARTVQLTRGGRQNRPDIDQKIPTRRAGRFVKVGRTRRSLTGAVDNHP